MPGAPLFGSSVVEDCYDDPPGVTETAQRGGHARGTLMVWPAPKSCTRPYESRFFYRMLGRREGRSPDRRCDGHG